MKECDILGVKAYSDPSYVFLRGQDPNPRIYAPGYATVSLASPSGGSRGQSEQAGKPSGLSMGLATTPAGKYFWMGR